MQSRFTAKLSLKHLLVQPLIRDAIYKHLSPLDKRTVDLCFDEEWMSPQQFFVDPKKPLCSMSIWPFFRECAYLIMDGIVATICANRVNVKILGFLACTSMELEEHRIGLKHTNCALRRCFVPSASRYCLYEHVRVTVYHKRYDYRYSDVYAERTISQRLTQYLQERLPNCTVSSNLCSGGYGCVHVENLQTNVGMQVAYRLHCEPAYIMPTSPILFRRSFDDWFNFQSNNNIFSLAHTLTWRFYDSCGKQISDWKRLALLQTGIAATEPLYDKQLTLRKSYDRLAFNPALRSARSFVETCWTYFEAILTARNGGKPLYDFVALIPFNIDLMRYKPQIYLNIDACKDATAAPALASIIGRAMDSSKARAKSLSKTRATTLSTVTAATSSRGTAATLPTAIAATLPTAIAATASATSSAIASSTATTPTLSTTMTTMFTPSSTSSKAVICHAYCLRKYDYVVFENLALIAEPKATFPNQPLIIPVTRCNQLLMSFYPPCDDLKRKIRQMLARED